jgi:hypothetical protein
MTKCLARFLNRRARINHLYRPSMTYQVRDGPVVECQRGDASLRIPDEGKIGAWDSTSQTGANLLPSNLNVHLADRPKEQVQNDDLDQIQLVVTVRTPEETSLRPLVTGLADDTANLA